MRWGAEMGYCIDAQTNRGRKAQQKIGQKVRQMFSTKFCQKTKSKNHYCLNKKAISSIISSMVFSSKCSSILFVKKFVKQFVNSFCQKIRQAFCQYFSSNVSSTCLSIMVLYSAKNLPWSEKGGIDHESTWLPGWPLDPKTRRRSASTNLGSSRTKKTLWKWYSNQLNQQSEYEKSYKTMNLYKIQNIQKTNIQRYWEKNQTNIQTCTTKI